jgi:hypothetical protein
MEVNIESAVPVNFVDNSTGELLASLLLRLGQNNSIESFIAEEVMGGAAVEFTVLHSTNKTYRDRVTLATGAVVFLQTQGWDIDEFLHVMAIRRRLRDLFARYNPTFIEVIYL